MGSKIVKFLFVIIFGTVVGAVQLEDRCNSQRQPLHGAENRALRLSAYTEWKTHSRVICGRECSMDKHCKSINFYEYLQICELNNATRIDHSEEFAENQGSVYFDADEGTSLFSVAESSLTHYGSCGELKRAGCNINGIYTIYPEGFGDGLKVYCDMETDGGGWTMFQRRQDGSVDFYRNWTDYKSGFGNLSGEFWLGNENLVNLTSTVSQGTWDLRVDVEDWDGDARWAKYKNFELSPDEYVLNIGQYDANSTTDDALTFHKGTPFTTRDNDNDNLKDGNCAVQRKGAWWFKGCAYSDLNGYYYLDGRRRKDGLMWRDRSWQHIHYSYRKCSMKMRQSGINP